MAQDFSLLVVGFILTTVLGGLLGYLFQRSTWNHQHAVQKADEERERASRAFEEVSRLLDKRLHRMRLINGALAGALRARANRGSSSTAGEGGQPVSWTDDLARARDEYRKVLVEWNDNLNRTLAVTAVSFGEEAREQLEVLYERYASLGRALDLAVRLVERNDEDPIRATFSDRLSEIQDLVYDFNVRILSLLQEGSVGSRAPTPRPAIHAAESTRPRLGLGDRGEDVASLQRKLLESGEAGLIVDGMFGLGTHRAVRRVQGRHGLPSDGVVNDATWRLLGGAGLP